MVLKGIRSVNRLTVSKNTQEYPSTHPVKGRWIPTQTDATLPVSAGMIRSFELETAGRWAEKFTQER
jgi:hypothetical protein